MSEVGPIRGSVTYNNRFKMFVQALNQAQNSYFQKSTKFDLRYVSGQTNIDRHTDTLIAILHTPNGGSNNWQQNLILCVGDTLPTY